jgi:hypothetical protein
LNATTLATMSDMPSIFDCVLVFVLERRAFDTTAEVHQGTTRSLLLDRPPFSGMSRSEQFDDLLNANQDCFVVDL